MPVEAVARDLPRGGTALEVGCGTGSLTTALATARREATVIGVDGDASILGLARRKPRAERVTWVEGLAGSFPLPAASADAAVCSPVLHHLADGAKTAALEHIAQVLAPRGVLHVAQGAASHGAMARCGPCGARWSCGGRSALRLALRVERSHAA